MHEDELPTTLLKGMVFQLYLIFSPSVLFNILSEGVTILPKSQGTCTGPHPLETHVILGGAVLDKNGTLLDVSIHHRPHH